MKKIILGLLALLILCALLGLCIFIALRLTSAQPDNACIAGSGEQRYLHDSFNFCILIPETWTTADAEENQVIITPDKGDGNIIFQAFERDEFKDLNEIDESFCNSFGEGFRSALNADAQAVNQFQFAVFELNGNKGCKAEGSLFEGVTQRYYVFFNKTKKDIYAIFYTENGGEETQQMQKSMDTFDIVGN